MKKILLMLSLVFATIVFSGCANNLYYAGMEKVGFHKRDIMVSRVEKVKDSQKEAQEEFKSALEHFGSLVNIKDTDLKKAYEKFNSEYESAKEAAQDLSNRIDDLEDVSLALFDEWKDELKLYKNKKLKAQSQKQLNNTIKKYNKMMKAMRISEKRMAPILDTFQDNVLMLKHSLNAQAIGALQGEFNTLKKEISILISQMNQSIKASNEFIKEIH
ncbi:DUF2959 domain-containing protein [Sulfurospirillum sp. 1307]|jgi:uncharacterized protein YdiU (UPF0061 family)